MDKKECHFIAVTQSNDCNAHESVRNEYQKIFNKDKTESDKIPTVYENLKQYISQLNISTQIPITISSDRTISAATIAALNEKFMIQPNDNEFSSNLKILYINDTPTLETEENENLYQFTLSSLFGLTDENIVKNKIVLNKKQLLLLGLNDISYSENQQALLDELEIKYFTADYIEKKNTFDKILHNIHNFATGHPLHIVLNLTTLLSTYTPSVKRQKTNLGMNPQQLDKLIQFVKKYDIVGLDILGFDASIDTSSKKASRITAEIVRSIFVHMFDIKQKSLNIYSEHSRFLIYRSVEQEDLEHDIGWRILRNIPPELKEVLMSSIKNEIVTIPIDCEDFLVTATSISEQEEKSYYNAESILDTCLFPDEKKYMMFELINEEH